MTKKRKYSEYDAKRENVPIGTRLTPAELQELDAVLKDGQSRSAFVKAAVLDRVRGK